MRYVGPIDGDADVSFVNGTTVKATDSFIRPIKCSRNWCLETSSSDPNRHCNDDATQFGSSEALKNAVYGSGHLPLCGCQVPEGLEELGCNDLLVELRELVA